MSGRMGKADFSELQKFVDKLEAQLAEDQIQEFIEACAKELAARLLTRVIRRTPTGKHPKTVEFDAELPERQVEFNTKAGKHVSFTAKAQTKHVKFTPKSGVISGGTLRRGWTAEKQQNVADYVNSLNVVCTGDTYTIEIVNPVKYASYVEFGHRTRNHKGWVEGLFMLTISSQEVQQLAPKILEQKLQKKLGEAFK